MLYGDIDGRLGGDNVIEDFEHNDLTGNYGGDTAAHSIQTGTVLEGTYSLEANSQSGSTDEIILEDGVTVNRGEEVSLHWQCASTSSLNGFIYGNQGEDPSTLDGVCVYVECSSSGDPGSLFINDYDNGSRDADSTSLSTAVTPDTEVVVRCEWRASPEDEQHVIVESPDGNTTYGTHTRTVTMPASAGGIGFTAFNGISYHDLVKAQSL